MSAPPNLLADIDETIRLLKQRGIDFCDAWWALGQRSPCGGWGRVRQYMIRWQMMHGEQQQQPQRRRAA